MEEELKPCPHCASDTCECFPVKDSMFQVACSECFIRGPRYVSQDEAIAAWNGLPRKCEDSFILQHFVLPRRLRWTQEKPKKDGYYWYKDKITMPMIADVDASSEAVEFFTFPGITYLESLDGEWAGPIPEPLPEDE